MDRRENDADLLARFVATFEVFDGTDEYGMSTWKPKQITTSPAALEALYRGLGLSGHGSTRFPPLYETLLLTYRWAEVRVTVRQEGIGNTGCWTARASRLRRVGVCNSVSPAMRNGRRRITFPAPTSLPTQGVTYGRLWDLLIIGCAWWTARFCENRQVVRAARR